MMNPIQNNRSLWSAFGTVLVAALALVVGGTAKFVGEVAAEPSPSLEPMYSYSVKFVCGFTEDPFEQATVRPGVYATEINIHNDNLQAVSIEKQVLILFQEQGAIGREPNLVEVTGKDAIDLPPDTATLDDCQRIAEITGVDTSQLTIGYLQLISTMAVAVDAVYTTSGFQDTAPSIEVERIEAKQLIPSQSQIRCETFDNLALGTQIKVGSGSFQPPNGDFWGNTFFWSDGTPTNDGYAEIQNAGAAGGSGHEVQVNNINFSFGANSGQVLQTIRFAFGEYGGNLNLRINDDFVNFEDFSDVDGTTIGGVMVNVLSGGNGNDTGEIEFRGTINDQGTWGHLTIGGQELFIDNFCWE